MEHVKIIQEGNEWVAVLPPHPDMPDEDLGLPAPTEEAAAAEARAYDAIMQSALYKFEFDDNANEYVVSIGKAGEKFSAPLLAEAYEKAQEAYTKRVAAPPPEPEPELPKVTQPVKRGPRKNAKAGNGAVKQEEPVKTAELQHEPTTPPPERAEAQLDMLQARIVSLEAVLIVFAETILKEIKNHG